MAPSLVATRNSIFGRGWGAAHQVDVMKEASKLNGFNWGIAEPLKCASFAYPRSALCILPSSACPSADAMSVEIPPAAASASELRVSERGNVLAGSEVCPAAGPLRVDSSVCICTPRLAPMVSCRAV